MPPSPVSAPLRWFQALPAAQQLLVAAGVPLVATAALVQNVRARRASSPPPAPTGGDVGAVEIAGVGDLSAARGLSERLFAGELRGQQRAEEARRARSDLAGRIEEVRALVADRLSSVPRSGRRPSAPARPSPPSVAPVVAAPTPGKVGAVAAGGPRPAASAPARPSPPPAAPVVAAPTPGKVGAAAAGGPRPAASAPARPSPPPAARVAPPRTRRKTAPRTPSPPAATTPPVKRPSPPRRTPPPATTTYAAATTPASQRPAPPRRTRTPPPKAPRRPRKPPGVKIL